MKQWLTEIIAICPITNKLKKWAGPKVPGFTQNDAQIFCNNNGFGYCRVIGQEIENDDGHFNPQHYN